MIDWRRIEDAIFEGLDANISCTQGKVRDLAKLLTARVTTLSTPVAQGDEVRELLAAIDEWAEDPTPSTGQGIIDTLATLTKGARDAG